MCQAQNLPSADSCAQCDADLTADGCEGFVTQKTRPRLLLLRQRAKVTDQAAARLTDPDIGLLPDPLPTPSMPSFGLKVLRGLRVSVEYRLYDGRNLIGRADDRPVDIDLRDQEPRDTVWASRHHAVLTLAAGVLTVEDLHSTNGTYVNRHRVPPGTTRALSMDDVLQIGTIQLKVIR